MFKDFFNDHPVGNTSSGNKDPEYNASILNGNFLWCGTSNVTTQKAKGIFYLQEHAHLIAKNFSWSVPKHILFQAGTEFDDRSFNYPVFARPCPVMPRHGFVDSIICRDGSELSGLSKETFLVEDKAEILVTKPIDCHYNVIINGGVITFAAGNDGATGGKGCRYFYIGDDPVSQLIKLDQQDIVAENEVPFYELVIEKDTDFYSGKVCLVQVRSAPSTPKVKDFVPDFVEVKKIIKADGDLLAWEKLLKEVDPKTTIIDHISGSLSSHYAIHAIVNKVPIFTSYVPELGSSIEPTVMDVDINEQDRSAFYNAFVRGFSYTAETISTLKYGNNKADKISDKMCQVLKLSLATLHNYSSIALSKDYEVLGVVLGLFCRVAFAVSAGESRYAHKLIGAEEKFGDFFKTLPYSEGRAPCYKHMIHRNANDCINDAEIMYRLFNELSWNSSFGGKKWALCTKSAINLYNACVNKEINKVIELFNKVINEEHNGGKYLNKVIDVYEFDKAALNPAKFTLENLSLIVDWLHSVWNVELKPIELSEIKIIEIVAKKANKSVEKTKLIDGYCHPTDEESNFTLITLIGKDKCEHEFKLPKSIKNDGNCKCSGCVGNKIEMFSAPAWWVLEDGTKIISKSALTKLKKKIGI
jgi:hypothetical protein